MYGNNSMNNNSTPDAVGMVATTATRVIGVSAIVTMAWVVASGLFLTPEDAIQGDAVRIMYVHVPTAWVAYLAFIVTGGASLCWLLKKSPTPGSDVSQSRRPV